MSHPRGGKQHREEMSEDESEYDKKWASMRRGGAPFNELMGPRGAHCTASTSTAGRLRDGPIG